MTSDCIAPEVLKDSILEALSDGKPYSSHWINNRLKEKGIHVTTVKVARVCQKLEKEGRVTFDGRHSTRNEWRLAA